MKKLILLPVIIALLLAIPAVYASAQAADLRIKKSTDETYTGDGVYNPTALNQSMSASALNDQKLIYHISIQNDGNGLSGFNVRGTGSSLGWQIKYFDHVTSTNASDITSEIIDGTWASGQVVPNGETKDIRVEITPDITVLGGIANDIYITITATSDFSKDTVRVATTCTMNPKPDLFIKESTAISYTGENIYNLTGENQTLPKNFNNTVTLTYYVKIENDGNTDGFKVTGSGSGNGWSVTYYDALAGGADITANIISSGGWSLTLTPTGSTDIRVEVTPALSVAAGSLKTINVIARSTYDNSIGDTVIISGTCVQGATLNLSLSAHNHGNSSEMITTDKLSMLQFEVSVPSGNESVSIDRIILTANGTALDDDDIAGIKLINDANNNGFYDSGDTVLAGPAVFAVNDGTATLELSPAMDISIGLTRTCLVVYQLNGNGQDGKTLQASLTSLRATGTYSLVSVPALGLPLDSNIKTIADVTASTDTGTAPLAISYSARFGTVGSVLQYEWDFNYDGVIFRPSYKSYMAGDITYTYNMPGSYAPMLKVTYFDGSVINRMFSLTVLSPSGQPSIASIITSPSPPVDSAPADITFTVNASAPNGIKAYLWDFDGDSIIDLVSATSAVNTTAVHKYSKQGNYLMNVMVEDKTGLMAASQRNIVINAPAQAPPTAQIISPTNPANITIRDSIAFIGTGTSGGGGGSIAKYEWDLDGDGMFEYAGSTLTNTAFTYVYSGTFQVRLRVTETPSGLTGDAVMTVNVNRPAVAGTPRLAFIQPGFRRLNNDASRVDAYGELTLRIISLPIQNSGTIDLRYRQITDIPAALISPDFDPELLSSDNWWNDMFSSYSIINESIIHEEFITTLWLKRLQAGMYYEIIALLNFNPVTFGYDDYNALQMNKRLFIYNETIIPEIKEDATKMYVTINKDRKTDVSYRSDAWIMVPYDGVSANTAITMTAVASSSAPLAQLPDSMLRFIGVYKNFDLEPNRTFTKPMQVKLAYLDSDNNGIVDGTDNIPESTLQLYYYSGSEARWYPVAEQMIDRYNKTISGKIYESAILGIAGRLSEVPIITGSSGPKMKRDWAFCAIATAAYGSPLAGDINILRNFRDKKLLTNPQTINWVRLYYKYSPPVADVISNNPLLRWYTRQVLQTGIIIFFTPVK
ncbi:MAG: CFI-box-CTERM domain-containing protein [Planctomycetota bacterium]